MKIKTLAISLLTAGVVASSNLSSSALDISTYKAYGPTSSPIEVNQSDIDEVKKQIAELKNDMKTASDMANCARKLGWAEDCETILNAKGVWHSAEKELKTLNEKLKTLENIYKDQQSKVYVGDFKLTGYCPCFQCSESYGGMTASGVRAVEGTTIAADPRKLPLGTRVYIEGIGERVVQDVGGAIKGNKIDIFVNSHYDCFKPAYNRNSVAVYVLK